MILFNKHVHAVERFRKDFSIFFISPVPPSPLSRTNTRCFQLALLANKLKKFKKPSKTLQQNIRILSESSNRKRGRLRSRTLCMVPSGRHRRLCSLGAGLRPVRAVQWLDRTHHFAPLALRSHDSDDHRTRTRLLR